MYRSVTMPQTKDRRSAPVKRTPRPSARSAAARPDGGRRGGGSVGRHASAALLAVPVVLLVGGGWARRWTSEDAFIDLRVVQQLVAGHGPVFNIGERAGTSHQAGPRNRRSRVRGDGRAWLVARFTDSPAGGDDPVVAAARRALERDGIRDVVDAVTGAMTPGRFLDNVKRASRLTALRIPADPREAEREGAR